MAAISVDEAARLAALLQEEDDDEEEELTFVPSGTRSTAGGTSDDFDIDAILKAYGDDSGSSDKQAGSVGQPSGAEIPPPPPPPAEGNASRMTGGQTAAPVEPPPRAVGGGGRTSPGLFSFIKGAVAGEKAKEEAAGGGSGAAPSQPSASVGSFASNLLTSSSAILKSSSDRLQSSSAALRDSLRKTVGGVTAPRDQSPSPETAAAEPGASNSTGSFLSSLASQVATAFTEGGAGGEDDEEEEAASSLSPFPSEDFREVWDDSKVSLWSYLSGAHPVRSVEAKVRPDVSEEAVLGVFETLALSQALVVKERGPGSLVVERSSGGRWNMVVLKLGVNAEKVRILLLQFFADPKLSLSLPAKVSAPASPPSAAALAATAPPGAQLVDSLGAALVEGNMTLSTLAPEQEGVVELDPHYVRDLQAMFAAEMMANLAAYAGPLDRYVKEQEVRCARLMTTLQPIYDRSGLEIPRPIRAKALASFPLETSRPSAIEEASLESAKAILQKVQSPYRQDRVVDVVRRVWKELQDWADDECRARVKRKNKQVGSRLQNVEQHAQALIGTLRDSPQVRQSPADRQLSSHFRVAGDEAVLYDCSASLSGRPGRLFVTASYLWFHSQFLGGFTFQKVLPLSVVASLENGSTLPLGGKTITVVDRGGERYALSITSLSPPDLVDRVFDVLKLVLECYRKKEEEEAAKPEARPPAQAPPQGGGEEEEEAVLVKKFSNIGMTDQLPASSSLAAIEDQQQDVPPPPATVPEAGLGSKQQASGSAGGEGGAALSDGGERGGKGGGSKSRSSSTGSDGDGLSGNKPRSRSLRSGIQAFLSESQGAGKRPSSDEPLLDFS